MKRMLKKFWRFVQWHLPWSVAKFSTIEEHFNLSQNEIAMIESCISYGILKESIVFTEDERKGYIVLNVKDVRKLIRMKRAND